MKEERKKYGFTGKIKSKNNLETVALLTIKEFPQVRRSREKLVDWLRNIANTIEDSEPEDYSEQCRFRLMR